MFHNNKDVSIEFLLLSNLYWKADTHINAPGFLKNTFHLQFAYLEVAFSSFLNFENKKYTTQTRVRYIIVD